MVHPGKENMSSQDESPSKSAGESRKKYKQDISKSSLNVTIQGMAKQAQQRMNKRVRTAEDAHQARVQERSFNDELKRINDESGQSGDAGTGDGAVDGKPRFNVTVTKKESTPIIVESTAIKTPNTQPVSGDVRWNQGSNAYSLFADGGQMVGEEESPEKPRTTKSAGGAKGVSFSVDQSPKKRAATQGGSRPESRDLNYTSVSAPLRPMSPASTTFEEASEFVDPTRPHTADSTLTPGVQPNLPPVVENILRWRRTLAPLPSELKSTQVMEADYVGKDVSHLKDDIEKSPQKDYYTGVMPSHLSMTNNVTIDQDRANEYFNDAELEEIGIIFPKTAERFRSIKDHRIRFPNQKPTGRADAIQLLQAFETMLEELQSASGDKLSMAEQEQIVYEITVKELVRQVAATCSQRGLLLDKVCTRYQSMLSKMPQTISKMEKEITWLNGRRQFLEGKNRELTKKYEDTKGELQRKEEKLEHLAHQKATVEKTVDRYEREIMALTDERDSALEFVETAREGRFAHEEESRSMRVRIEHYTSTIIALRQQNENTLGRLIKYENQLKVYADKTERLNQVDDLLDRERQEKDSLNEQLTEKLRLVDLLANHIEELTSNVASLEGTIKSLNVKLDHKTKECEELEFKLSTKSRELNDTKNTLTTLEKRFSDTRGELQMKIQECDKLKFEVGEAHRAIAQEKQAVINLQNEMADQNNQINTLIDEVNQLKSDNSAKDAQIREKDELYQKISEEYSILEASKEMNEQKLKNEFEVQLKAQQTESTERINQVTRKLADQNGELEEARNIITGKDEEIASQREELKAAVNEIETLRTQLDEAQAENRGLVEKYAELSENHRKYQESTKGFEDEKKSLMSQIDELKKQVENFNKERGSDKKLIAEHEKEISRLMGLLENVDKEKEEAVKAAAKAERAANRAGAKTSSNKNQSVAQMKALKDAAKTVNNKQKFVKVMFDTTRKKTEDDLENILKMMKNYEAQVVAQTEQWMREMDKKVALAGNAAEEERSEMMGQISDFEQRMMTVKEQHAEEMAESVAKIKSFEREKQQWNKLKMEAQTQIKKLKTEKTNLETTNKKNKDEIKILNDRILALIDEMELVKKRTGLPADAEGISEFIDGLVDDLDSEEQRIAGLAGGQENAAAELAKEKELEAKVEAQMEAVENRRAEQARESSRPSSSKSRSGKDDASSVVSGQSGEPVSGEDEIVEAEKALQNYKTVAGVKNPMADRKKKGSRRQRGVHDSDISEEGEYSSGEEDDDDSFPLSTASAELHARFGKIALQDQDVAAEYMKILAEAKNEFANKMNSGLLPPGETFKPPTPPSCIMKLMSHKGQDMKPIDVALDLLDQIEARHKFSQKKGVPFSPADVLVKPPPGPSTIEVEAEDESEDEENISEDADGKTSQKKQKKGGKKSARKSPKKKGKKKVKYALDHANEIAESGQDQVIAKHVGVAIGALIDEETQAGSGNVGEVLQEASALSLHSSVPAHQFTPDSGEAALKPVSNVTDEISDKLRVIVTDLEKKRAQLEEVGLSFKREQGAKNSAELQLESVVKEIARISHELELEKRKGQLANLERKKYLFRQMQDYERKRDFTKNQVDSSRARIRECEAKSRVVSRHIRELVKQLTLVRELQQPGVTSADPDTMTPFQERLQTLQDAASDDIQATGFARMVNRVIELKEKVDRLEKVAAKAGINYQEFEKHIKEEEKQVEDSKAKSEGAPWKKQPRVRGNVPQRPRFPEMFGDRHRGRAPKPVLWLVRLLRSVYDDKLLTESTDIRQYQRPPAMPEFTKEWISKRYGLKNLVDQTAWDMWNSVEQYKAYSIEIDMFARFLREEFSVDQLSFFLYVRTLVADWNAVLETAAILEPMFLSFDKACDIINRIFQPMTFEKRQIFQDLVESRCRISGQGPNKLKEIDVHRFLMLAVVEFGEEEEAFESKASEVFALADFGGSQTLTVNECAYCIRQVAPRWSESHIERFLNAFQTVSTNGMVTHDDYIRVCMRQYNHNFTIQKFTDQDFLALDTRLKVMLGGVNSHWPSYEKGFNKLMSRLDKAIKVDVERAASPVRGNRLEPLSVDERERSPSPPRTRGGSPKRGASRKKNRDDPLNKTYPALDSGAGLHWTDVDDQSNHKLFKGAREIQVADTGKGQALVPPQLKSRPLAGAPLRVVSRASLRNEKKVIAERSLMQSR